MPTNCVNCGALLMGSKCQYRGAEYGDASYSEKKQKAEMAEMMGQLLKASISVHVQQAFVISGHGIGIDAVEHYSALKSVGAV